MASGSINGQYLRVVDNYNGIDTEVDYPIKDLRLRWETVPQGGNRVVIIYHDKDILSASDVNDVVGYGNDIFGSTDPTFIRDNAQISLGITGTSGGGGGGAVVSAIDATAANQLIGNASLASINTKLGTGTTLSADIAAIRANTAKISQFSFQLAEDSAGTVFLIKTDTVAGTSSNINVATGAPFTPVGAIELTDPITNPTTIDVNEYKAITTSAGNWTIDDVLERVRTLNTSTGAVGSTFWYKANGTLLGTIPVIGTDVIDTDGQVLTELATLNAKIPSIGQAPAAQSIPVVLTAAQLTTLTPPTGLALDTSVNALLKPASTLAGVTTLGSITNALPAGTNTIGNVNQTLATAGLDKLTDGVNIATVKAASTAAVAADTALVVTVSPNSGTATSSLQTTGNTSLSSIDTKIPALGQALSANSVPVVLTAAQLTTLTPPTGLALDTSVNALLKPSSTLTAVTTLGTITNALPTGTNTIGNVNQTLATAGLDKLTDGTNIATVTAASTSAVTTDTSLVVALSPNSNKIASDGTLGAATGTIGSLTAGQASTNAPTYVNGNLSQLSLNLTGDLRSIAKISDGTTTAAVKVASVSAVPTDTALVVALSPNSNKTASEGTLGAAIGTIGNLASGVAAATGAALTAGNLSALSLDLNSNLRVISRVTDGTNNITIKAASTNALAADTAEVVTLRPQVTSNFGGTNPVSDLPVGTVNSRVRGLLFTNLSGITVYVGVYNSATALLTATLPVNGYVIRVPTNATLDKGVADFGETGRLFGANTRIGLSSTFGTYTPLTAPQLALCSLNVEVIN